MNRTIILSNRLPLKIEIINERIKTTESAGGLATGLKSFHQNNDSKWIGWPGLAENEIPLHLKKEVNNAVLKRNCIPVSLSSQEIMGFYDGFCNHTLWPLFHYFLEYTGFEMWQWEAYKRINLKYAKKILEYYRDGDIIWVHDYQLLLVPNLIRQKKPNAIIGFFLHIPFPSFEIFRLLHARFRMEFDEVRKLLQDFTSLELNDKKREFRSEVY